MSFIKPYRCAFLLHNKQGLYRTSKTIAYNSFDFDAISSINGIDIGIPLNLISNVFTNLHYNQNIMTNQMILLQFLIGYYTYGKDRYKDAIEYDQFKVETKKELLYNSILKYKHIYRLSYCVAFYSIALILYEVDDPIHTIPILTLLYSTEYYKDLKKNISFLKPFYVSFMWTFATIILPSVLYEHNYDILFDVRDYIPCMLLLFASTNLADINDIKEDKMNKIETFPILFGEENTYKIMLGSIALSSFLFGIHPNYLQRPIVNSLFELQNIVLSTIIYFKIQNNRY